MDTSQQILSDITVFNKYAKFIPEIGRREDWLEICQRNMAMHIKKYPQLKERIQAVYRDFVIPKKVLPSMRSMQFGGRPIELANNRMFNCFSRDTAFITAQGTKTFEDFSHGDTTMVLTHTGQWKSAVVKNYGKQELHDVTFLRSKARKTVRVTRNHRWLLSDGSETTNLSVGDSLLGIRAPLPFDYDDATPFEKLYWCYGYVFGDGSLLNDKNGIPTSSMARLCGKDAAKFLYRFDEMGFSSSKPLSAGGDPFVYTGKYLKAAPQLDKDSRELVAAFTDGYLCADGYKNTAWYTNPEASKYISIQSSDEDHVEFLQSALESSGYFVTTKKDVSGTQTNLGVYRKGTTWFGLSAWVGKTSQHAWKVQSISDVVTYEDVWCLEVEDDHSFVLSGGMVTGNCAFVAVDHPAVFSETMFLLLGGSGVGYSVQKQHVAKLPVVVGTTNKTRRFLVGDSIEGWADCIKVLVNAHFYGKSIPLFDYRDIRVKGSRLVTSGGKAPGADPLRLCVEHIQHILAGARGRRLNTLEVHDVMCHIADAVLSGGIRRAALIALFSADDFDMMSAKTGSWWELNPQRGRANNSVVLDRNVVTEDQFKDIWYRIEQSRAGEPGISWTNNTDLGFNPCHEISLKSGQFCNVTEVNVMDVETQQDLNDRCRAGAFLGTLQAGYTDFHYLRPIWKENTEADALIGVGMTGIASEAMMYLDLDAAAAVVLEENSIVARIIGINPCARGTTVKPGGTTSLVVGSSSGIHAWHAQYYWRRMRIGKNEALYAYIKTNIPELVEDCFFKPHTEAVMKFPQKAPAGAILRSEDVMDLLARVIKFNTNWVAKGYRSGENQHNVSCTISLKDDEWKKVGNWMWDNRNSYTGISVMPYDGGTYVQAPFEDCTEEDYLSSIKHLSAINLQQVVESDDNTNLTDQVACGGGACELQPS